MAVLYKTAQSILANKDGKKLFYPRVVLKGNVSTATMTVRFLPCYTKNPDRTVATRSMVTGVKCIPYGTSQAGGSGGNGNGDSGGDGGIEDDPLG